MKRDLVFYLANIYAEIHRAKKYRWKLNDDLLASIQRMIDLFLKIQTSSEVPLYRKIEIGRVKEALIGYLIWDNFLNIDEKFIENYFWPFISKRIERRWV